MQPGVNRDKIQRPDSENEQIGTPLDRQREQVLADYQAEIRKHESSLIITEEVH